MNPFRSRSSNVFSESDLIAAYFGELPTRRRSDLLRALEQNSSLAAESAAIAADLRRLTPPPVPIDQAVLDRNWQAIQSSLVPHGQTLPAAFPSRLPIVCCSCAAIAVAIFFVTMKYPPHTVPIGPVASISPARTRSIGTANSTTITEPNKRIALRSDRAYPLSTIPDRKPEIASALMRPAQREANPSIHMLGLASVPGAPAFPLDPFRLEPAPLSLYPLPPSPVFSFKPLSIKPRTPTAGKAVHRHTTDLMLGLGGNFLANHTSLTGGNEPRTETVTPALSAMAAFHQQFRPAFGYRITASYSRPDFTYTYSGGTSFSSAGEINSRIFELAATYVVQGPHHRRLSTSADAGGALLAFLPTQPDMPDSYVFRGAAVVGANVDIALTKHWGARVAYRAQVYKGPDFRYTGTAIPVTSSYTVSNEPTVGITYGFGKR